MFVKAHETWSKELLAMRLLLFVTAVLSLVYIVA